MHDDANSLTSATRREFVRRIVRHSAVGGMIAGLSLLVLRSESDADARCIKPIQCNGCNIYGDCQLPKALAARQERPNDA